jgi:organic radical activating enzyme
MESFPTIQGEGVYSGHPAWFLRLGGCDVGCVWCDVKESWDVEKHPHRSIADIQDEAVSSGLNIAVITGGEPLMHKLDDLTQVLQDAGLRTHIESSGTHPISGNWDWFCFSPKKFKKPLPEVAAVADELKVVIYHPSDFAFAEEHAGMVSADCQLLLQPEWSKRTESMEWIVDYVKQNPRWRVSLQTHKYLQIP